MKRLRYLLVFILMLFLPFSISSAKEIPNHDSNYYIDELGVLSEDTKKTINDQQLPGGAQIFVLTVDKMDEDPQDYGVRAFEKYKLGSKDKDNGLLILLARTSQGKHHVRVITGYGLEGILPDGRVGRIIDEFMMDDFKKGDLDIGIYKGFKVFSDVLSDSNNDVRKKEKSRFFKPTLMKLVLLYLILRVSVSYRKNEKKANSMTYEDFLKDYRIQSFFAWIYMRRLRTLSVNKSTDEIKTDIERAGTFKYGFAKIYKEREEERLKGLSIEEVLDKSKDTLKDYEKELYQNLLIDKIIYFSNEGLCACMKKDFGFFNEIIREEYRSRLKNGLDLINIETLLKNRSRYKDPFIDKREVLKMVDNTIKEKNF